MTLQERRLKDLAAEITSKYSSYAVQLRQQRDQLQIQLSGVETELNSVYQATQRLGNFQPRIGLVYSCPQCWIDTATSSPLRPQDVSNPHESIWACAVCGSQFPIPKLEAPEFRQ
jgi:hypothetical protein